ncbi:low density lipoprotein receptor adapter protein 1-like [Festucalex cinctus]
METLQSAGGCPALGQTDVETWLSPNTRGCHGDGMRFKAKLIGVETVLNASGDKMCRDSMNKLKRMATTARKRGMHKQRVWLKVSSRGLQIVDQQTGALHHEHDRSQISSLVKDKQDVRALAYIYQQEDTYNLFYFKMAHLAKPVLDTIKKMFEKVDQDFPECSTETLEQDPAMLKSCIHLSKPRQPNSSLPESQQQIMFPTQPLENAQATTPSSPPPSPLEAPCSDAPANMSLWGSAGMTSPAMLCQIPDRGSQSAVDVTAPPSLHLIQMNISLSDFCTVGNPHESLC